MALSRPHSPKEASPPALALPPSKPSEDPPAGEGGAAAPLTLGKPDRALGETLSARRARLVWVPALAGLLLSFLGWVGVPHLFVSHPEVLRSLQFFYMLLGVQSLFTMSLLAILGSQRLGALAQALSEGTPCEKKLIDGAAAEAAHLPTLLAILFVIQSFVLSFGTTLRGHLSLEIPADIVVFATLFGVGLGLFGAGLMGTVLRLQLAPFTRTLSRLGIERLPGQQRRFTSKVAAICGLVSVLAALLTGAVGYYFADRLITAQLADHLSFRMSQSVDAMGGTIRSTDVEELPSLLSVLAPRLHPESDLGVIRDGSIAAATSPDLSDYLALRSVGDKIVTGGAVTAPRTRCLLYLAPLPSSDDVLLLRVPRHVVGRTLRPMQTAMVGLILTTMALSILLGWTSARGMQIPLSEVARITTRVARGDLTDPGGRVLSDDAFGELATEIAAMRDRLAQTVSRVVELSQRVASSAQETMDQAQQIGLGAEAQVASVTTVGQANDALDKGLHEVAEIIRRVANTFREATDSGAQVEREFDDLTRDVEALATEATEAAEAVAELSQAMNSVAGDVSGLSEAAERATRAASDADKALGRMREHAGGAAEAARRTITAAKGGAESVRRTVEGIGRIRDGSDNAVARVEDLSRRISEVDRVLAVIDDIAEKTNLLALNASIIAAQAGEQGKSFAVVAGEVRDLANRTAASTQEIAATVSDVRLASREVVSVIRSSGARIEEGVSLAGEAERSLEEILGTTYEASAAAGEIASATDLQSRNVSEVRDEIDQVATMAARIASVGEAQTSVAASASRAAERIASLTSQVNLVIASLTERNRALITTFTNMGGPVALVDKTLDHQAMAMAAINQENSRIRDIAMASSDLANRLDESARTIEEAAESLASEVHYFRL